jgi:hypothetical protein
MTGGNGQFAKQVQIAMRRHRHASILVQGQPFRLDAVPLVRLSDQVARQGAVFLAYEGAVQATCSTNT